MVPFSAMMYCVILVRVVKLITWNRNEPLLLLNSCQRHHLRPPQKGRTGTFPQELHLMVTDLVKQEGGKEIAAFLPHGRAFCIYKPKEFANKIMPMYFRMSHFSSFQRQLNLYEFQRIREGRDKGGYYHSLFLENQPALCSSIHRTKIL